MGKACIFDARLMLPGSCPFNSPYCASAADNADEWDYPLGPFYPAVKTISTDRFLEIYFDAIIIDVRSRFEFEVVRINNAKHVPLAAEDFIGSVTRYRAISSATPMVFYCNDSTCSSAFRAALLAQAAGFIEVYVYDTGVFPLAFDYS